MGKDPLTITFNGVSLVCVLESKDVIPFHRNNLKHGRLKEINSFGSDLTFRHIYTFLHRLGPFQEAVPGNKNHSQPPQQSLSWDLGTKYWSSSVQVYYSKFSTNGQLHVVIAALAIFLDRVCCLLLKRKCEAAQSVVFGVHVHLKKQFDKTI